MRVILASAAAVILLALFVSGPAVSQGREYAYCSSGLNDCSYTTLAQCKAAVSGTPGDCTRNPRYRGPRIIKRKVYD